MIPAVLVIIDSHVYFLTREERCGRGLGETDEPRDCEIWVLHVFFLRIYLSPIFWTTALGDANCSFNTCSQSTRPKEIKNWGFLFFFFFFHQISHRVCGDEGADRHPSRIPHPALQCRLVDARGEKVST